MNQIENQATADGGTGIEILRAPEELDLLTADSLVEQGSAAIASRPRLLLLDLTGLAFCDASGLNAFVRIANRADAAGCRYGLIAPRPPVAKMLRIGGLHRRLPVLASIDDAMADFAAMVKPADRSRQPPGRSTLQAVRISRPVQFPAAAGSPGGWTLGRRPA